MLRTTFIGAAVALALGASGFTAASAQDAPPPPGAPVTTPQLIRAASQSDEFEIQEGHMAQSMGAGPRVKAFAARMVHDHTMTTQALHRAIREAGMPVPPPPPLRPDQQQMMSQLQGLSGRAFDRAYIDQQVMAHQQALALMEGYAHSGDVPSIRHAAEQAIPIIRSHLEMAQSMQSSMGT